MSRYGERTLERLQALQALFQAEAAHRSVSAVLSGDYLVTDDDGTELFVSTGPIRPWARELALGCDAHRQEVDGVLARISTGWDISRMNRVDRNLLRVALYELLFEEGAIPAVVANEAVVLAKSFSDESNAFVNGIIGAVVDELEAGIDPLDSNAGAAGGDEGAPAPADATGGEAL